MNKRFTTILFIGALALVAIFYNYQEIVFKRPQSVHKWRQSDCASIALNYYHTHATVDVDQADELKG